MFNTGICSSVIFSPVSYRSLWIEAFTTNPFRFVVTPLFDSLTFPISEPEGRRRPFLLYVGPRRHYKNLALV
jgi:hypothetical protein